MEDQSSPTESPSSFFELIVDHRERQVHDSIETVFMMDPIFKNRHPVAVKHEQMEVGDYIIQAGGRPLAIIERKTLCDFAASIKDGRVSNTDKMLALAKQYTKCDVYYLIEGELNPSMNAQFAHTPYKNILAAIRLLQIRHGVQLIMTKNIRDTALQLKFLCEIYSGMIYKGELTIEGASREDALDAIKPDEETAICRVRQAMWATLGGISATSAIHYAPSFTVRNLLLGRIELGDFRINNRKPTSKAQESIAAVPTSVAAKVAILACIPGITEKSAMKILDQVSVEDLLGNGELDIHLDSGKNKVKVGADRIAKWRKYIGGGVELTPEESGKSPSKPGYLKGLLFGR